MAKFKFIGEDGSMGYKKNKIYRGNIKIYPGGNVLFFPGFFPLNLNSIIIPYQSLETFKENWERQ